MEAAPGLIRTMRPELTAEHLERSGVCDGVRLVRRGGDRPPLPPSDRKRLVNLRLDEAVSDASCATGLGWETRIGGALHRTVP